MMLVLSFLSGHFEIRGSWRHLVDTGATGTFACNALNEAFGVADLDLCAVLALTRHDNA